MNQHAHASSFLLERLPVAPRPMRVLDHLIEIISVIDEPLPLDEIFHYLLARGYEPQGSLENLKQYVYSLLKKHTIYTNSSWRLTETDKQPAPLVIENLPLQDH